MSNRSLALIADDFALTPCISDSILQLIDAGRLSGTGAMVTSPHWPVYAKALAARADQADAGLHIDLTVGPPVTGISAAAPNGRFPSMLVLSLKSFCFSAVRRAVTAEIVQQIELFRLHYGALPAFLDGHRHIHVLPGIRSALFAAIRQIDPDWTPWVRSVEEPWMRIGQRGITPFKTMVISVLSTGMRAQAEAVGLPVNDGFAGVTDFDPQADFGEALRTFLRVSGPKPLVMVHPGLAGDAEIVGLDAVVATRPLEHAYLSSDRFAADLAASGLRLHRLSDLRIK